ncbi:MAG: YkgJ family cysteine cluster protein [Candidatus Woesearchaeota archaeon]|nr:YkgJ family cysteine cluster protein [Candidatus Woesearchaeota archaeon]
MHFHSSKEEILSLGYPCKCDKCENPCKYGSGVLADDDYEKLAKYLKISVDDLKRDYLEEVTKFSITRHRPKLMRKDLPHGKCIFFDVKKGCKVHEAKPLECKVAMSCKDYGEDLITWFDVKHFFDPKDKESLRQYKIYVESGGKVLEGAEIHRFIDEKTDKELGEYEDIKDSRKKDWDEILGIKDLKDEPKNEKNGKNRKN